MDLKYSFGENELKLPLAVSGFLWALETRMDLRAISLGCLNEMVWNKVPKATGDQKRHTVKESPGFREANASGF